MLPTSLFDYHLPKELIAQKPADKRDESRLLVIDRKTGEFTDEIFKKIINYFHKNDLLVLNDTRVIPARLFGRRKTGGLIEILLQNKIDEKKWEVLARPGRRVKIDEEIIFAEENQPPVLKGKVIERTNEGGRILEFEYEGNFEAILEKIGKVPLPPYIHDDSKPSKIFSRMHPKSDFAERYQTVFAQAPGASAAPTAGLHFTNELLEKINGKGIKTSFVTLHTGMGTFKPIIAENIEEHKMHPEFFSISLQTAKTINETKNKNGRIISVGTTTTRVLETVANEKGFIDVENWRENQSNLDAKTKLFIYPGYKFKIVDVLITNFHLPRSTLLALVSAFASRDLIFKAYNHAINKKYRFFSFGDAMLII
jgi:S-adenosylmethionine:tRNA ribosyltransferase-isomerase